MAIELTHVHYAGSVKSYEEMLRFRWIGVETGKTGMIDVRELVDWIDRKAGEVIVIGEDNQPVPVETNHPKNGRAFVRSRDAGRWTNELLMLPVF